MTSVPRYLGSSGSNGEARGTEEPRIQVLALCYDRAIVTIDQLQHLLDVESPFARAFAFQVIDAASGSCTIEAPYQSKFDRPDGIVSGAVLMTAADVAMWLAIKTLRGLDDPSVTSHMQTQFLESARGEAIRCTAKVVKAGARMTYGTAECLSKNGTLLTHHTLTYVTPKR